MKKILLAAGDSFTDQNCRSYQKDKIVVWPELLADKLDMRCVNIAQAGAGNEQIYSSVLDWVCKNGPDDIGLVVAGWSKCERMDYEMWGSLKWHNTRVSPRGNLHSWIRKSVRNFYSLQLLCEHHNIPLKQFQMISLFRDYIYEYHKDSFKETRLGCIETLMNTEQYDYIDESNFIGWPIYDEANGFVVGDKTVHFGWKPINKLANGNPNSTFYKKAKSTEFVVSDEDVHPNQLGHQMIMEFIHENL